MPSQLALILVIGFIIFLLRVERQLNPSASASIWIPTIWLIHASSKPLAYWFGQRGLDMESGSPLDRTLQIILLILALRLLARRRADWTVLKNANIWLSVLILYMLISILWSPIMFVSFKRWVGELLAVVMGLLIATEDNPRRAIQCVFRRTIYIQIPLSVLLIKYFPQHGVHFHRWSGAAFWSGVASQKNSLGILASLASFFLIWSLVKRWQRGDAFSLRYLAFFDILIIFLSIWLLKGPGTYSATSLIMLASGLLIYFVFMTWNKQFRKVDGSIWALIVALIIVYGIATPLIGKLPFGDFSSEFGRDSTLTGRSVIWAELVPLALSKPVLGHGWGGFWTTAARQHFYTFPAHNGYLETVLVIGFIGLLLLTLFLMSSARKAIKELNIEYDWGVLWICWLFMALVNNIAESTLPSLSNLLIAIPLWLAISFKDEKRSA